MNGKLSLILFLCVSPSVWASSHLATTESGSDDVSGLNIEDLVNVQVTSVSKKAQALSDAPAAIFVISNDDIKRSGVTSVPEALRMAPGVEVARINSNKWAISARGSNGSFANKLLVLIDGRSVYTPAFSGVYWDSQDVLMDDVERIEVIRGPGATLWGANAVNGVINIITKNSEHTQGGLLTAGGGTTETGFGSLRYGKKLGDDTYARAYVKGLQRDEFKTPTGLDAGDAWNKQQGGFRLDSRLTDQDQLTVLGDIYRGRINQTQLVPTLAMPYYDPVAETQKISGWNVTSKLQHTFSSTSAYTLQFYYDRYSRSEYIQSETRDTLDVDFQHNFKLNERQNFIWGLDYRYSHDDFGTSTWVSVTPSSRGVQLFSGFLQDEIMLIDETLWFTLGSKFEHNDYTGFEGQPTAKLMWTPAASHKLWASVSRAVRTPSRAESNVSIHQLTVPASPQTVNMPVKVTINGNQNLQSEALIAYELGYRFTFNSKASLDVTAFYNDYSKLRGANHNVTPQLQGTYPNYYLQQNLIIDNHYSGNTYGFEMAAIWQMMDWWRWDANYSFLETNYSDGGNILGTSPKHKASVRAGFIPMQDVNLDFWLRYVGDATALNTKASVAYAIPHYLTLDMRLAWKPHESLELSVAGQNLLDDYHLEYIEENFVIPTEIARGVYGKVAWQF
ncbi:MAG: TonB-dependent receptor [Methylococcales bacterium]|nr:TonB-dependent receptor [Methylococcales bacterium]